MFEITADQARLLTVAKKRLLTVAKNFPLSTNAICSTIWFAAVQGELRCVITVEGGSFGDHRFSRIESFLASRGFDCHFTQVSENTCTLTITWRQPS